jgi:hypothetical protein
MKKLLLLCLLIAAPALAQDQIAGGRLTPGTVKPAAMVNNGTTPSSSKLYRGDGSWQNIPAGTVTSVTAGAGLTGGTITGSGTIAADFGTGAGKIAQGNDSRITGAEQASNKDAASGYAGLTAGSLLKLSEFPAIGGSDVSCAAGAASCTVATGAVTDTKASLANKPSVGLLAASNLTLSGAQTVDSVAGTAGTTLVLATAQSTGSQNGPWIMQSGAWTRPTWYPAGGTTQAFQFITVLVRLGSTYQGTTWRMTTSGAVTIDTTATSWAETALAVNATSVSNGVTGSGAVVLATSPTLSSPTFTTPALGTPTSGIATNLTGTAAGLTAGNVTTNANLTGPITSSGNATAVAAQTGTGSTFVMQLSPTLTTPNIGAATATTVNKMTLTAPATGATLTIADAKTLTISNTLTLAGTDGSTLNVGAGGTLASGAYAAACASVTGLRKGAGLCSADTAAASGTDYAPATSGSAILKGNGAGGFSNAAAGTDYIAPNPAASSDCTASNTGDCGAPLAADFTTPADTSLHNTNLVLTLAASTNYRISFDGDGSNNTNGDGAKFAFTIPASATINVICMSQGAASTSSNWSFLTASGGQTLTIWNNGTGGTTAGIGCRGTVITAGSSGALTLQLAAATGGQATLKAGSVLTARKVGAAL